MEKKKLPQKHESSDSHAYGGSCKICHGTRNAVMGDIGDLRSERHALQKSKNKKKIDLNPVQHLILSATAFAIKRRLKR